MHIYYIRHLLSLLPDIPSLLASHSILMIYVSAVLASTGIGALSAREAEGRANISSAEKVIPFICVLVCHLCAL